MRSWSTWSWAHVRPHSESPQKLSPSGEVWERRGRSRRATVERPMVERGLERRSLVKIGLVEKGLLQVEEQSSGKTKKYTYSLVEIG